MERPPLFIFISLADNHDMNLPLFHIKHIAPLIGDADSCTLCHMKRGSCGIKAHISGWNRPEPSGHLISSHISCIPLQVPSRYKSYNATRRSLASPYASRSLFQIA